MLLLLLLLMMTMMMTMMTMMMVMMVMMVMMLLQPVLGMMETDYDYGTRHFHPGRVALARRILR
jgi:hypothetical protein